MTEEYTFPDALDQDDKIALGVGRLVMEWCAAESIFVGVLECLLGREKTDNASVVWLSLRTTEARMALITQLAKVQDLDPVTPADIASLCDRFKGISKVRNFYCHAHYVADPESGSLVEMVSSKLVPLDSPLRQERRRAGKSTLNELKNTIMLTHALNLDAWHLFLKLREALTAEWLMLPPMLDEYLTREGRPRS